MKTEHLTQQPYEVVRNQPDHHVTPMQHRYSVASMFAGCGGMDLGFRGDFTFLDTYYARLPFDIIWANEINAAACRTYRRNLDQHIICGDIWDHVDMMPQGADVLIGGFPCQDISINGKGAGIQGQRSGLYRAMVEAIKIVSPRIFIAENVKGLLMRHNKASLEQILEDFNALGYTVSYKLYHAANYGVPQSRERVFIVGTREQHKPFVPPAECLPKTAWRTAEEAIGDLEGLDHDPSINHIWSLANRSPDQGNRQLDAKSQRKLFAQNAMAIFNIIIHCLAASRCVRRRVFNRFQMTLSSRQNCVRPNGRLATLCRLSSLGIWLKRCGAI